MQLSEYQTAAAEARSDVSKDDICRILAFALKIPRLELPENADRELTKSEAAVVDAMLAERENDKPLQYIFGETAFRNLKLVVGKGVLIPRPETEMLVDLAEERLATVPNPEICDLGTGSGAVALALAQELPDAMVTGVDASRDALAYAERNKTRNKIGNVEFLYGDLLSPFSKSLAATAGRMRKFSLITANLPYVSKPLYKELPREIRGYEPESALLAGAAGLDLIRRAAEEAPRHLKSGAYLIFEHSPEQTGSVAAIFAENSFRNIETIEDLTGKERFTLASMR